MTEQELRRKIISLRLAIFMAAVFAVLLWIVDPPEFSWGRMALATSGAFAAGYILSTGYRCVSLIMSAVGSGQSARPHVQFAMIILLPGITTGVAFFALSGALTLLWQTIFSFLVAGFVTAAATAVGLSISRSLGLTERIDGTG